MLPNSTTNFQGGNASGNTSNSSGSGDATSPAFGGGAADRRALFRALQLRDNVFLSRDAKQNGSHLGAIFGSILGVLGIGTMGTLMLAAHRQTGSVGKLFGGSFWKNAKFKNFFTFKWGTFFKKVEQSKADPLKTPETKFKEHDLSDTQKEEALKQFTQGDPAQWEKLAAGSPLLDTAGKFSYLQGEERIAYDQEKLHHFTHADGTEYLYWNDSEAKHHLVVDSNAKTAFRIPESEINKAKSEAENSYKAIIAYAEIVKGKTPNTWDTLKGDTREWCHNSKTGEIFCRDAADKTHYSVDSATGKLNPADKSNVEAGLKTAKDEIDEAAANDPAAIAEKEKLRKEAEAAANKITETGLKSATNIERATKVKTAPANQWLGYAEDEFGGAWCKNTEGDVIYRTPNEANYYNVNPKTGEPVRLIDADRIKLDEAIEAAKKLKQQQPDPEKPLQESETDKAAIANDKKVEAFKAKADLQTLNNAYKEAQEARRSAEVAKTNADKVAREKGGDTAHAALTKAEEALTAAKQEEALAKTELEKGKAEVQKLEREAAETQLEAEKARANDSIKQNAEQVKSKALALEANIVGQAKSEAETKIAEAKRLAATRIENAKKEADLKSEQYFKTGRSNALKEPQEFKNKYIETAAQQLDETEKAAKNAEKAALAKAELDEKDAIEKAAGKLKEDEQKAETDEKLANDNAELTKNQTIENLKNGHDSKINAAIETAKEQAQKDVDAAIQAVKQDANTKLEEELTAATARNKDTTIAETQIRAQAVNKAKQERAEIIQSALKKFEDDAKAEASVVLQKVTQNAEQEMQRAVLAAGQVEDKAIEEAIITKNLAIENAKLVRDSAVATAEPSIRADVQKQANSTLEKDETEANSIFNATKAKAEAEKKQTISKAEEKKNRAITSYQGAQTIQIQKGLEKVRKLAIKQTEALRDDLIKDADQKLAQALENAEKTEANDIKTAIETRDKAIQDAKAEFIQTAINTAKEKAEQEHAMALRNVESKLEETKGLNLTQKQADIQKAINTRDEAVEKANQQRLKTEKEAKDLKNQTITDAIATKNKNFKDADGKLANTKKTTDETTLKSITDEKDKAIADAEKIRDQAIKDAEDKLAVVLKTAREKRETTIEDAKKTLTDDLLGSDRVQTIDSAHTYRTTEAEKFKDNALKVANDTHTAQIQEANEALNYAKKLADKKVLDAQAAKDAAALKKEETIKDLTTQKEKEIEAIGNGTSSQKNRRKAVNEANTWYEAQIKAADKEFLAATELAEKKILEATESRVKALDEATRIHTYMTQQANATKEQSINVANNTHTSMMQEAHETRENSIKAGLDKHGSMVDEFGTVRSQDIPTPVLTPRDGSSTISDTDTMPSLTRASTISSDASIMQQPEKIYNTFLVNEDIAKVQRQFLNPDRTRRTDITTLWVHKDAQDKMTVQYWDGRDQEIRTATLANSSIGKLKNYGIIPDHIELPARQNGQIVKFWINPNYQKQGLSEIAQLK